MKIAIIEDHAIIRELLATVCQREFGYEVCVSEGLGRPGADAIKCNRPDMVILDLMLPDIDGFEVAQSIRSSGYSPRIVAISVRCDPYTTYRIERGRFHGFLDKRTTLSDELRHALSAIHSGRRYFSASFLEIQSGRKRDPQAFDKVLTSRQHAILALIGELFDDSAIAAQFGVTVHAIEKQRFRIMQRLGITAKNDLLRYARKQGLTRFTQPPACDW